MSGASDVIKFPAGGMWEFAAWYVFLDCECSPGRGVEPCEHCRVLPAGVDGEPRWVCPAVVVAENEGGYSNTGVCLQCVLAAAGDERVVNVLAAHEAGQ